MKTDQSCKNCKYFVSYYVNTGTNFFRTNRGFCCNKRKSRVPDGCERFEPVQDKSEERQRNIFYCLDEIRKKLDYIVTFLSESQ